MPFTPFHFGPAIFLKAIAPRTFSLAAFVAVQVVIDVESLYHLVRREWPVHRELHSMVGGTAAGLVVAVIVWWLGRWAGPRRGSARGMNLSREVRAEMSFLGALTGGVVGGVSHSILDGMMHVDVRPYWPFSDSPGWLNLASILTLHAGCLVAAALGAVILWWVARRPRVAA